MKVEGQCHCGRITFEAEVDPDASPGDASARFPGSAEERRFGSDGSGAWGGIDRRPAPSGGSRGGGSAPSAGAGGAFSDAPAASKAASGASFGRAAGVSEAEFAAFGMDFERAGESCPIK